MENQQKQTVSTLLNLVHQALPDDDAILILRPKKGKSETAHVGSWLKPNDIVFTLVKCLESLKFDGIKVDVTKIVNGEVIDEGVLDENWRQDHEMTYKRLDDDTDTKEAFDKWEDMVMEACTKLITSTSVLNSSDVLIIVNDPTEHKGALTAHNLTLKQSFDLALKSTLRIAQSDEQKTINLNKLITDLEEFVNNLKSVKRNG